MQRSGACQTRLRAQPVRVTFFRVIVSAIENTLTMPPPLRTPFYTLPDLHGDPLVEFRHYPDEKVLHLCWHGHLTADEIVQVGQLALDQHPRLDYQRVLNDKRNTSGDWHEALPWLRYEWLPRTMALGLRAVAYIFSTDLAHQLATQEFVASVRPQLAIELFREPEEAWKWLLAQ